MTHKALIAKTRPLLLAGALFAVCVGSLPAVAQTSNEMGQLLNRLNQLENQVQTLNRALFRDNAAPAAGRGGDSGANANAAAFDARMSQIEDQQRQLTGQIEKLVFDVQKLQDAMLRQQADVDQRFQQQQTQLPVVTPVAEALPVSAPVDVASAADAAGTLGSISTSGQQPPEALYERAFGAIKDSRYADAERGFKDFLRVHADHPLAANAQYWLGETYYVRGDYKQAARVFAQGYQTYPKSAKSPDSLLKLGLSLSQLGSKDDACISLRQLQQEVTDAGNALRKRGDREIKALTCP